MRIVFAGTPVFGARALAALLEARHDLALVLTQPDRPAGRGLKPVAGPVRTLAEQRALPLSQPVTLKTPEAVAQVVAARPEVLVVAAYGLILPRAVLGIAPRGAINIHASLLPRWRGAAPIQRAILAGDRETGITIMQMDAGLDTGPILLQRSEPISEDDDSRTLHDRLAALGARLIVEALERIGRGDLHPAPQPEAGACYAAKISRSEAALDWSLAAAVLERAVRAFRPAPGAHTILRGEAVKIWRARVATGGGEPGTVLQADTGRLCVACGEGALELLELQRAGARRMDPGDFMRGFPVRAGERFGAAR